LKTAAIALPSSTASTESPTLASPRPEEDPVSSVVELLDGDSLVVLLAAPDAVLVVELVVLVSVVVPPPQADTVKAVAASAAANAEVRLNVMVIPLVSIAAGASRR